jgi:hypothetical protein
MSTSENFTGRDADSYVFRVFRRTPVFTSLIHNLQVVGGVFPEVIFQINGAANQESDGN